MDVASKCIFYWILI